MSKDLWIVIIIIILTLTWYAAQRPTDFLTRPDVDLTKTIDFETYYLTAQCLRAGTWPNAPFYFNPGITLLTAMVLATGAGTGELRLLHYTLVALTNALIYLVGKHTFDRVTGVIAAGALIFYPPMLLYAHLCEDNAPVNVMTALCIWFILRLKARGHWAQGAGAGLALGLATVLRPNLLLFWLALAAWAAYFDRANWRRYALLFALAVLPIAPFTIKNYLLGGRFVLISTNGAVNLWIGNNPAATGLYMAPPPATAYALAAREFIATQPLAWLGLMLRKIALCWTWHYPAPYGLLNIFGNSLTTPLFLLACCWYRRWRTAPAFLLLAFILSYTAGLVLIHLGPMARLLLHVKPYVFLFAAFALRHAVAGLTPALSAPVEGAPAGGA